MNKELREKLIQIAKVEIPNHDVAHDYNHALRVLFNAEKIAKKEGWDLDIIVPAALFHDLVVYKKNDIHKHRSQEESAEKAVEIMKSLENFSEDKIEKIKICILDCSFSKGVTPHLLESKILQDADGLESTGLFFIMRTFSCTGQIQRSFYDLLDPFCNSRKPDSSHYAWDLIYERVPVIVERMHTKTAKNIARRRTNFLLKLLKEFKLEMAGK